MATKKPILNFVVDPDLLSRIDDFRFQNRFDSRAAAVKWLIEWALNEQEKQTERRKGQG